MATRSPARIDIGAIEYAPPPAAMFGDYNADGVANAADYVKWRKTMGSSVAAFTGADGDGDGMVDPDDLNVWRTHFGQTVPAAAAGSGSNSFAEWATPASALATSTPATNEKSAVDVTQSSSLAAAQSRDEALIAWLSQGGQLFTTDREAGNAIRDHRDGHDSFFQSLELVFIGLDVCSLRHASRLTPLQ